MKVVRTEPLRNTSITTLCAKSFYHAETDAAIYKHAEKLSGDLWRAGVAWKVEFHPKYGTATATVTDADGDEHCYIHDYAIVALAGAAEMASGRRVTMDYEPFGVGHYQDAPASMVDYEAEHIIGARVTIG